MEPGLDHPAERMRSRTRRIGQGQGSSDRRKIVGRLAAVVARGRRACVTRDDPTVQSVDSRTLRRSAATGSGQSPRPRGARRLTSRWPEPPDRRPLRHMTDSRRPARPARPSPAEHTSPGPRAIPLDIHQRRRSEDSVFKPPGARPARATTGACDDHPSTRQRRPGSASGSPSVHGRPPQIRVYVSARSLPMTFRHCLTQKINPVEPSFHGSTGPEQKRGRL